MKNFKGIISRTDHWLTEHRSKLIVSVLVLMVFFVGTALSEKFGTSRNMSNLFGQASFLAIIALGQTLPVLTRGIDLSIGSTIAFCAVLTSALIDSDPVKVAWVVPLILGLGLLVGLVNALGSYFLRIHPLIMTIGMAAVLRGTMLLYSDTAIGGTPDFFAGFAMGRIVVEDGGLTIDIWSGTGLAISGIFVTLIYILVYLFLRKTRHGLEIYAVGGEPEAARLAGLSVLKSLCIAYGFCGFCSALAAIYIVSQQGVGSPELAVKGYELASVTPVVVGGTLLSGGVGGVVGTFLGVILISMLSNLLNFVDISTFYQWIIQGLIVIAAVSFYGSGKSKK